MIRDVFLAGKKEALHTKLSVKTNKLINLCFIGCGSFGKHFKEGIKFPLGELEPSLGIETQHLVARII